MVLLDLAKAFNMVCHDIDKLCMLSFGYGITQWFASYLTDRHQQTVVEGRLSTLQWKECGVPQGSILAPPPTSSVMVCLHRAGHCSGTKSKALLISLSILWQWRGQFYPRQQLLMVDRPTAENVFVSTSIYVHR